MISVITALKASANSAAIRVERDGAKWLRLPVHLVADLGLSTGEEMDEARVEQIEQATSLMQDTGVKPNTAWVDLGYRVVPVLSIHAATGAYEHLGVG